MSFKKSIVLLSAFLFVFSAFSFADESSGAKYIEGNLQYYRYEPWTFFGSPMRLVSDLNPRGVMIPSDDFTKMMKRVPAAYKCFTDYQNKEMLGAVIMIGGELVAVGIVYLGISSSSTNSSGQTNVNVPLIVTGVIVGEGLAVWGEMMAIDGVNDFYKSINEYNKGIVRMGFTKMGTPVLQTGAKF